MTGVGALSFPFLNRRLSDDTGVGERMKVVLFCGGQGLRMRGGNDDELPKPMVPLGTRPILWHLMKYYAHWGHCEFILCLGHKSAMIKEFFVNYEEWISNDLVLTSGGREIELLSRDMDNWRITMVDTGLEASIGERLLAVQPHLGGEEMFLANYADGLTDCPLPAVVDRLKKTRAVGTFVAVRPSISLHFVQHGQDGRVTGFLNPQQANTWVNAGFFAFRREIFRLSASWRGACQSRSSASLTMRSYRLFPMAILALLRYVQRPADTGKSAATWRCAVGIVAPFRTRLRTGTGRAGSRSVSGRLAMMPLLVTSNNDSPLHILCVGAHPDDIEIGAGGTILTLLRRYSGSRVHWLVLSAPGVRAREARASANAFLREASVAEVQLLDFRDGFFPAQFEAIKVAFEALKPVRPDIVLTHHRADHHQDHRLVSELTWNTFRDHLILEYEIPKYDPDFGNPNLFVPVDAKDAEVKITALMAHFVSQHGRSWFTPETFFSMMRIRGVQAAAPSGLAEAFYAPKLRLLS